MKDNVTASGISEARVEELKKAFPFIGMYTDGKLTVDMILESRREDMKLEEEKYERLHRN